MCRSDDHSRLGSRVQHGAAHAADHEAWTRRRFLSTLGIATAGGTLVSGSLPMRAMGHTPFLQALAGSNTDRILVLVQLEGGNDGLNTVVPFRDDAYHRARPGLRMRDSDVLRIADDVGLHPAMSKLASRFQNGDLAIVRGVGYPEPDLSHFRSTDIWVSASDSSEYDRSGWGGRAMETLHPDFVQALPQSPVAVQLGGAAMMFRGREANLGMRIAGVEGLDQFSGGNPFDVTTLPGTTYGEEMAFLRTVANSSFRYADAIRAAGQAGSNRETFQDDELSEQLAAVARLIRGGLDSRVYHVSLDGFDTHSEQAEAHAYLLGVISEAIDTFLTDLAQDGLDERVVVMTFSEFGRTIVENGSAGTDHATTAPHFLAGPAVSGGLLGAAPDFSTLNDNGDLLHAVDFRSLYASVLEQWFGLEQHELVLGSRFPVLPLIGAATQTGVSPEVPDRFASLEAFPNPVRGTASVELEVAKSDRVAVTLFDVTGRAVRNVFAGLVQPGVERLRLQTADLPAGVYVLAARGITVSASRTITVLR
ncbi:MAG: DUF1501 domain-containing protein [Rhodothermales bacterium]|nr:DUF1501 domain-containing protein [Rhodothermales bacterium]MBO6778049.1 DUF1501 domain-containing protein [Rhodothermales bacterium]